MDHSHHHHEEVILPLRLAAEPYAKRDLSSSAVALGVCHNELAIFVNDNGIIGIASERNRTVEEIFKILPAFVQPTFLEKSSEEIDKIPLLIRDSSTSNTFHWSTSTSSIPRPKSTTKGGFHDTSCAKWITDSIRKYYSQQVLEPSVRGFLNVLEKQFTQSNLYVFELLQNAVDDGATHVQFHVPANNNNNQQQQSLVLTHNGRPFTPLDLLGLSSVGLSTKSRQGKRTVGFMGVGFKAVYKRYAKVTIDDGRYAFSYEEPPSSRHNKGGGSSNNYGWVMLPLWQTPNTTLLEQKQVQFQLQRPRGGFDAIIKDLAILPKTAPPLLGRAALLKQDNNDSSWTLDWNGNVHVVRRTQLIRYTPTDMSEIVTVDITRKKDGTKTYQRQWLFLTHDYLPSKEALDSYQRHTKRTWNVGEKNQVCGFLPLTLASGGTLQLDTTNNFKNGVVHSVLPTKIKLPLPLHLQASFLLSVDRQQVQDFSDNAWNLNILHKLPNVIAIVFRWAAHHKVVDYRGIAQLLPMHQTNTTTQLLNQPLNLQSLQQALRDDPIVPIAMETTTEEEESNKVTIVTDYYKGSQSIWVPPAFLEILPANFLRNWLGKRPLKTNAFGFGGGEEEGRASASHHPIWRRVVHSIDADLLTNRKRHLADELQLFKKDKGKGIETLLRVMAAIGAALFAENPIMNSSATTTEVSSSSKSNDKKSLKQLPSQQKGKDATTVPSTVAASVPSIPRETKVWPLFLNDQGALSTIDQVLLPAEDMASLPSTLRSLLRPYFVKATSTTKGNNNNNNGFQKQKKRRLNNNNIPSARLLHPDFEAAICAMEATTGKPPPPPLLQDSETEAAAIGFLKRVRLENTAQVVDVGTATSRLLESYAQNKPVLSEDDIANVVSIAQYGLQTNNPKLLSYVLVDKKVGTTTTTTTKLVPASKAYIGKSYDETTGADLESFAGPRLTFVSSTGLPLYRLNTPVFWIRRSS